MVFSGAYNSLPTCPASLVGVDMQYGVWCCMYSPPPGDLSIKSCKCRDVMTFGVAYYNGDLSSNLVGVGKWCCIILL